MVNRNISYLSETGLINGQDEDLEMWDQFQHQSQQSNEEQFQDPATLIAFPPPICFVHLRRENDPHL